MAQVRYPSLYQINTRVWLTELRCTLSRPATLDDIPDADLDHLAEQGSDSPWFLSIWQTALAGQRISRSHPEWRGEFQETLPDLREGDIADMCTGSQVNEMKGAINITFAGLRLVANALCGIFLVSCVVSPQRPAAQYSVSPQGPTEQAVAQAFEALVRAYGRQDWDDVMALIADDAQIEPAVPDVAGPAGVDSPRVINKREFGQAIKPILASIRGYHVEHVKLMTVSPTQVEVSGTVTLLMAGRPSLHDRDRLWVFEKRGERWLVVRAQYL